MSDPQKATIDSILATTKVIAVVGLSSQPDRPSHGVAAYLKRAGYRIIPVNPNETEVLGEKAYASLEDVPEKVHLVDIFRRPEFVPPIVVTAIQIGAHAIWMQDGIVHDQASRLAQTAGLDVVMDRCIFREHLRWKAEGGQPK